MRFARSTTSTACSAAMSLWRSSGVVVTGPIIPHRYGRALLNHRVSQSVAAPDQVSGRLSARHLWTPGANRVPPVDPVKRSRILIPLLLTVILRQIDVRDGAGLQLPQRCHGLVGVREQIATRAGI